MKMNSFMFLVLQLAIYTIFFLNCYTATSVVKSLPGFPGTLPFSLETGYISVGENEEVELFYYFLESERDPSSDPLIVWLTGGPGCSGFSSFIYSIGPLKFNLSSYDGSVPSLVLNPYSWSKVANVILIDSPVGTGFSYATTSEGYASSDIKATKDKYTFMRKWLLSHPTFIQNPLYVAGDSYAGILVPLLASEIDKGNEDGLHPRMALQGYIIGNTRSDALKDDYEKILYAHKMGIISDEYFELAESSCHGEYVNPDPNNHQCLHALRLFKKCTEHIFCIHVLEPRCLPEPRKSWLEHVLQKDIPEKPKCREYYYWRSSIWNNDENVREALHIRKGTVAEWIRCNYNVTYEITVESVLKHHQFLTSKGYRVLAYSGDHDMCVPYTSTLKWIRELNLTIDTPWRPWTVEGQVAGYAEIYKDDKAHITFATVKGAGHTAPEYKPKECFAMFTRWLSFNPL